MNETSLTARLPLWFWITSGLGLVWNLFGVFQFSVTALASQNGLMMGGMTEAQARLYFNLPIWMNIAFATGVFGGLAGSALLLLRRTLAMRVFMVSLAGYIVLYIGDITQGVFAIMGMGQVIILTTVVAIAVGLLWVAQRADRYRWLH